MYTQINADNTTATSFKESWTLEYELSDGDYTVDFKAYGKNKDSVTGADFLDVPNAQMGFTVDTNALALSLSKTALETLAKDEEGKVIVSQFGSNVVFADSEGNFTIEGVTDYSATLTADGEAVAVGNNGIFTYTGKLADGENSKKITLKAADKANNETELTVFAIVKEQAVIEKVEILYNGKSVSKNENGEAVITIKNGDEAVLTVKGYSADGTEITIDNPVWDILYEKNLIEFEEGRFIAKAVGETAVKAGISNGTITLLDTTAQDMLLEDYVIINIEANSKDDLLAAITDAEANIAAQGKASQSAINNYQAAIDAAKAVYNNPDASADDIEKAVEDLKKAGRVFDSAKSGTTTSSGSGGGSSIRRSYTVNVEPTENGTVTLSQTSVYSGNSLTITATPNEGYEVGNVLVNGISYGSKCVDRRI